MAPAVHPGASLDIAGFTPSDRSYSTRSVSPRSHPFLPGSRMSSRSPVGVLPSAAARAPGLRPHLPCLSWSEKGSRPVSGAAPSPCARLSLALTTTGAPSP
jgi:hypothetical protein